MARPADGNDAATLGLAATLAVLGATAAGAESTATGLGVTATILPNCSVSLKPLVLNELPRTKDGTVAAGALTVTCTKGTAWTAVADGGHGTDVILTRRAATSTGGGPSYNLYVDSGRFRIGKAATTTPSDTISGIPIRDRIAAERDEDFPGTWNPVMVTVTY